MVRIVSVLLCLPAKNIKTNVIELETQNYGNMHLTLSQDQHTGVRELFLTYEEIDCDTEVRSLVIEIIF